MAGGVFGLLGQVLRWLQSAVTIFSGARAFHVVEEDRVFGIELEGRTIITSDEDRVILI